MVSFLLPLHRQAIKTTHKMKTLKVREVLKMLRKDGWFQLKARHTSGDHRQFKHPTKPGKVTVNGKQNDDIRPNDLHSIFDQAGWEWE